MDADSSSGSIRFADRLSRWIWIVALIALLAPLAFVAYLGVHSRYLADDFCTAGWLNELGFWSSQSYWYKNWSGRFSFIFLMSATQLVGPALTPWLSGAVLLFWLAVSWWAVREATTLVAEQTEALRPALLAATVLLVTVATTPKLYQSLLWQTGLLTYTLPLALLMGAGGWTLRQLNRSAEGEADWRPALLAGALAFVAGGMSETFAVVQTALLAGCLLLVVAFVRDSTRARLLRWHLGMALIGSVGAGIIVAAAPGNAVRQGALDRTDDLVGMMLRAFRDAYIFAAQRYSRDLLWMILAAAIPFLLGMGWRPAPGGAGGNAPFDRRPLLLLVLVPIFDVLLVVATMAPSEYALSSYPDGRILITAHFALSAGLAVWGGMMGYWLATWVAPLWASPYVRAGLWLLVLAMVAAGAVQFMGANGQLLQDARTYAERWDSRHRQLISAARRGEARVQAASLTHMGGLAELSLDPDEWINRCVADTYGLREVQAK